MTVSTQKPDCQRWFDEGLNLEFNFNQPDAQKAFMLSAAADPTCAMAQWGLAWALGPFINKPFIHDGTQLAQAYQAAQNAARLASSQPPSAKERGLIKAMSVRYPPTLAGNQTAGWQAYSDILVDLMKQMPQDNDVCVLAAESLMTLMCDDNGYNFYDHGVPTEQTKQVFQILEAVNNRSDHPFARHLYIHITEASTPGYGPASAGRAKPSADGLLSDYADTDAQHLQHMAGHTYLHVGAYDLVVKANLAATDTDQVYLGQGDLGYGPGHNAGFLVYGAVMRGQLSIVLPYSDYMRGLYLTAPDRADGIAGEQGWNIYKTSRLRFGDWAGVLADKVPMPRSWPYALVLGSYATGMASVRLKDFKSAQAYYATLQTQAAQVTIPKFQNWTKVANLTLLAGLTIFADNNYPAGEALLQRAVDLQDSWPYKEPPPWHVPMRECLGRVQLQMGKADDADATFRHDLADFPNNPFSLWGLVQAMTAQPTKYSQAQIKAVEQQRDTAWSAGEVPLTSSCLFFDPL